MEYSAAFSVSSREPSSEDDSARALGQVFTPPALVNFILDQAGYRAGAGILRRRLLEPACGEGAFLVAAAHRLADELEGDGVVLQRVQGRRALADAMERCLRGVDLDAAAVTRALGALHAFFLERTGAPPPDNHMRGNIVCSDYLLGERSWPDEGFDFVVGNPPYVSTTAIGGAYKAQLRAEYSTASGRLDLYGVFIERAVVSMRPSGTLAFIVPDKFLASQSALPLRAFLRQRGVVRAILRFQSHKVFDDAATVPCVLVFERGGLEDRPFTSAVCEYKNGTSPGRVVVHEEMKLPHSRLANDGWLTSSDALEELAQRIAGAHPRLGQLSERISAGFATGRDGVFVVPQEVARTLDPALLRPAVRGRDLAPFSVADPHLSIIVPYTYGDGRPELVALGKYRRTLAYLTRFRHDLERRHCVRAWEKRWFDLHDPVPFDLAAVPKILVPDVAESPRFVFDEGKYCPLHSAYYVVPSAVDGHFAAAVLNSKPIEFLLRLRAPVVKDGFNRYRKQFLLALPIPQADHRTSRRISEAARHKDGDRLDEMLTALFRLSDADRRSIDTFLANLPHRLKKGASRGRKP